MRRIALGLAVLLTASAASANALRDLAREIGLTIYSAKRLDTNLYEVTDYASHYIVETRYCYVYASIEDAVVTKNRIYFLNQNDSCEIEGVMRK